MAIASPLNFAVVYFLLPLSFLLPIILYGTATGVNNWLVPPDRAEFEPIMNITGIPVQVFVPSNGRLGMQYFCPNTAPAAIAEHYKETGEILTERDIPPPPCYWMEPSCDVTYCVYDDSAGAIGLCAKFDIFDPQLPEPTNRSVIDTGILAMHNIISNFPGGGSCAAYRSSKWFHYISFTCAVVAMVFSLIIMALFPIAKIMSKLQEVMAMCAMGASVMHMLAFVFSIITLSVWGGSVTNSATPGSYQHSGFWTEVSACIIVLFCAPVPFAVTLCELPEVPHEGDVESKYIHEMETKPIQVPTASDDSDRLTRQLQQVTMDRDSKVSELDALKQQLGAKSAELESLRDAISAKDRQIASLEEELARLKNGAANVET